MAISPHSGARIDYERHRPEQTTLYRLVRRHAATFFAEVETAKGSALPKFVKDEFDAFLECGILAHGLPLVPRLAEARMRAQRITDRTGDIEPKEVDEGYRIAIAVGDKLGWDALGPTLILWSLLLRYMLGLKWPSAVSPMLICQSCLSFLPMAQPRGVMFSAVRSMTGDLAWRREKW